MSTTVLVELFASFVLFGELGIVLCTASAPDHTRTKEALINMVPKASPNPKLLVRLTGVLEVLGLLILTTRGLAGPASSVSRRRYERFNGNQATGR